MKRIYFILISGLFAFNIAFAQTWIEEIGVSPGDSFAQIKSKAELYFQLHPEEVITETIEGFQYDSQYKKYKRWEWYWRNRVTATGEFPEIDLGEYIGYQEASRAVVPSEMYTSGWTNINQTSPGTEIGYDGMGRATSVYFHSTDINTYIVSAAIGGIWKTTDGGASYTSLGENLPYLAVSDVVMHPTDSNILYVATGDAIWYGLPSLGVLKTTDGGATWSTTGLNFSLGSNTRITKMLMDPSNSDVILAATTNGLYRTTDGGISWSVVNPNGHWDIQYKPGDATTVYALASNGSSLEVFKSTNGGGSFSQKSFTWQTYSPYAPSFLAVTPANSNKVMYLNGSSNNLYASFNSGESYATISTSNPAGDALVISPSNSNNVYIGQLDVYKSTNGGSSFIKNTHWYNNGIDHPVHADSRRAKINPLDTNHVYFCNDGGLYKYNESADSWTDLSTGLVIMQYYSVATSQTNPERVSGGTQDNGSRVRNDDGTWRALNGGDGMQTAIDNTNDDIIYCTYINGQLYRTLDGWLSDTYTDITPSGVVGEWVTPYELDPSNNNTIVAGYNDVYRSTNRGNSWTRISNNIAGGQSLDAIAVAHSNSAYIYASNQNSLYYTTNTGSSWNSASTSSFSANITSIEVHPTNPAIIWVTLSGYHPSNKVFYSTNSGTTWTNVSSGLPNVPINKIVYEKGSADMLYVGTDTGFYYKNGNDNWQAYNTNLPLTQVRDIELQYSDKKIRIGTHGRGIFESDFMSEMLLNVQDNILDNNSIRVYPNPSELGKDIFIEHYYGNTLTYRIYNILGVEVLSGNLLNGVTKIANRKLKSGVYVLKVNRGKAYITKKFILN